MILQEKPIALPPGVHFVEAHGGIEEYNLDNGLRIVLKPYPPHTTPVIKFGVWYDYASRHEKPGKSGIAHFLEHNMFKGTKRFDTRKGNGAEIFTRVGGQYNATTTWDRTEFHEILPADRLALASAFEADRMDGLLFNDWRPELDVVLQELDQGNDDPQGALLDAVLAAAFPNHPYGVPIIGKRQDVARLTRDDLVEAYSRYFPDNATVILVGGYDRDEALSTIAGDFGAIPRSPQPIPKPVRAAVGARTEQRRVEVRRPAPTAALLMAYNIPAANHPDVAALDVLGRILGGTRHPGSRLYEGLVERGIAHGCSSSALLGREPFAFLIKADVPEGGSPQEVEECIYAELARLQHEPVSEEELSRIQEANRNATIRDQDDPLEMFNLILAVEALGLTWRGIEQFDRAVDRVTPADVRRVAATYFDKGNSTVGILIPDDTMAATAPDERIVEKPAQEEPAPDEVMPLPPPRPQKPLAPDVMRYVLDNGLTLQVVRNQGRGTAAVSGLVYGAGVYSGPRHKPGIASLTASMLNSSSSRLGKTERALIFQRMGLPSFAVSVDDYHASFKALVAVEYLPELAATLADLLANPVFPQRDLGLEIALRRQRLTSMSKSTSIRAELALVRNIYPDGHPLRKPSIDQALAAVTTITVDDLRSFHRLYRPASTILTVVADMEPQAVLRLFEREFGAWKGEPCRPAIVVPPVGEVGSNTVWEFLPGNAAVDIAIGRATGISRLDQRGHFASAIANEALGRAGLDSRLALAVRRGNGLVYDIRSSIGDPTFGAAPWAISLATNPANIDLALSLVDRVVARYRQEGISDAEFADAVNCMAGRLPMRFLRSSSALANTLAFYESLGLGAAGIDGYVEALRSVSKDDVNEVIRDVFDLSKCVTALAGTISPGKTAGIGGARSFVGAAPGQATAEGKTTWLGICQQYIARSWRQITGLVRH
jgi:zinc protease